MHKVSNFSRSSGCALVSLAVSCVLVLSSIFSSVAVAQSTASDVDFQPPVINFEEVEFGSAGEIQVFTADVNEDQELASVVLFHRLKGEDEYQRATMKSLPGSTIHSASVTTDAENVSDIEYYIQAEDVSGNRAIKGFVFDPLIRKMTSDTATPIAESAPLDPAESGGSGRKWLWGLLGLLAVGVLAGAAGGGSSGSDTPPSTTPITIQVTPTTN